MSVLKIPKGKYKRTAATIEKNRIAMIRFWKRFSETKQAIADLHNKVIKKGK
jgi:hypothetical protein